ncbi:xanthine dehydrogenase family protein subunit M [Gordonia sp. Z-3]|uniref:Xanthine dehydrogenase family protein subunit M n=1 Tax=Gordonia tangerina TaxID=2911060 RepID=A0ABS9DIM4_9ACTN|nr:MULTISPECIES: xanthine dehydrogenase family protein subunit M [Gordonia]MAU80822.1 carbon monoxide dehydrogenase [Gordonia sp. (in: high G+C Gram-positive bacteria)]MCF3938891.1 xanthine dehydrogenase family protein subunit M [Gordonia tangerina]MED5803632.1 xanthine dehydrogenase family protein subunit M [Gordonia sp. Z-3]
MIPSEFEYVAPTSLAEALSALADAGEDAKVIAGGQSLMPVLRLRLNSPSTIIDLGRIEELRGVRDDGDALVVGAMTTHHDVMTDALVGQHATLLAEATATVADPQIRHRGTFGGSLAHADPAGDLGAVAVALDTTMTVAGPNGRRSLGAEEFFTDIFTTALEPDEILVDIRIPKHTGWRAHYEKFHRVSQSWSMVAVAATVDVDGGTIRNAAVALTNMGAVPVRARGVEQALVGQSADIDVIRAAADHAAEGAEPMSDTNADAEYRTHLAKVLTRRAVVTAAGV